MILSTIMGHHFYHSVYQLFRVRGLLVCALFLHIVLCPGPAAAVPKTDVITLINGDKITCEIKEMIRGKVRAKTDPMGTVSIEWDKVADVTSTYWFLITLQDGSLLYGQLENAQEDGYLVVIFQDMSTDVLLSSIVEVQPVRYDLWDRFSISAAFGFSWNKGSQVLQSNLDANVKYKGAIYSWGTDLTFMITDRGEGEITRRNLLNLWLQREISGRFNGGMNTGSERNDELGLRQRISGGLNLGYYLMRSNHLDWQAAAGASLNKEWATDSSDPTNNAEGHAGTQFTLFYYDSPKSDVSLNLDAYPSFTVKNRLRFEGSLSGRQEIIRDLFIKLEYYESRDNKPPSGAGASSDRGIVLSIEWTK
jgi:hypothetical protein